MLCVVVYIIENYFNYLLNMIKILLFNINSIKNLIENVTDKTSNDFKNIILDLKNRGYIIYGVTNGTVKDLNRDINKLECKNLIQTHNSNDKILLKDHYLQIIQENEYSLKEMLVIDSNYLDICIARKLDINVCLLDNISLNVVLSSISYYQNENSGICKKTAFQKNINIVIPIMGDNLRFKISSYRNERNLIDMMGKPIFAWVINNLQIDANYIFIVREHLCRLHNFHKILQAIIPNCTIIQSEKTEGNAGSILLAESFIDNDLPLIIINDNQWLNWDVETYIIDFLLKETALLQMITFVSNGSNRYKYIKPDQDNKTVLYTSLDRQISEYALTEVYFWRHGKDFIRYTHKMTSRNQRILGEICTTLVANELFDEINNGTAKKHSVIHRPCDNYFIFQDPNDITVFENWYNEFQLNPRVSLPFI